MLLSCYSKRVAAFLLFTVLASARPAWAEGSTPALFKLKGKSYGASDLSSAQRQQLYDLQFDAYNRTTQLAEQTALDLYLNDEAKAQGIARSDLESKILGVPDPSDKDVNAWYEANKSRIPPGYTLDKIAGEVKSGLKDQAKRAKREELLAKLKKDGVLVLALVAPEAPVLAVATSGFPARGPEAAKVTVVEFADYQCPHCKAAVAVVDGVLKKYGDKVRFVFMDFPIKGEFSDLAAQGAYCASQQGKFWQFHDAAYEKQDTLHDKDAVAKIAKGLSLDETKFNACLPSEAAKQQVAKAKAEGEKVGISGTPTLFVNGRKVHGYEATELEKAIDKALNPG